MLNSFRVFNIFKSRKNCKEESEKFSSYLRTAGTRKGKQKRFSANIASVVVVVVVVADIDIYIVVVVINIALLTSRLNPEKT